MVGSEIKYLFQVPETEAVFVGKCFTILSPLEDFLLKGLAMVILNKQMFKHINWELKLIKSYKELS